MLFARLHLAMAMYLSAPVEMHLAVDCVPRTPSITGYEKNDIRLLSHIVILVILIIPVAAGLLGRTFVPVGERQST